MCCDVALVHWQEGLLADISDSILIYCFINFLKPIDCFMYIWFNSKKFCVLPKEGIHIFDMVLNWLVLVTETECVYSAVRTESLYIIQVSVLIFAFKTEPCLRRLVAGLSARKPGFDPRSVHVRFIVDKVANGTGFFQVGLQNAYVLSCAVPGGVVYSSSWLGTHRTDWDLCVLGLHVNSLAIVTIMITMTSLRL